MKLVETKGKDKSYLWITYKKAMQSHIENIWGWDVIWQKKDFKKNLTKYKASLISQSGKIVGYVQYEIGEEESYINMLILEPSERSLGFGKRVLKLITNKKPSNTIVLRCFKVNIRAYQFYLHQGFQVVEEEEDFFLLKNGIHT